MTESPNSVTAYRSLPGRISRVAAICFMHVCGLVAFGQEANVVRTKSEAVVRRDTVSLLDIARLPNGSNDAIGRISLGYSPNFGAVRQITCGQIRTALDAAGFSDSKFKLACAGDVRVRRAGQTVTEEMLTEAVGSAVRSNVESRVAEVRVVRVDLPRSFQVATGTIELTAKWPAAANVFAPFSLPIEVRVDGRAIRTVSARLEIEAFGNVLVATRDIAANTSPRDEDLQVEKIRLSRALSDYVTDLNGLRGISSIREITAGTPITTDALVSVAVVRPGDTVKIEASSAGLKLIVAGEARSGGRIGDRVSVKNVQSGAVIQAVVADKGLVRVEF